MTAYEARALEDSLKRHGSCLVQAHNCIRDAIEHKQERCVFPYHYQTANVAGLGPKIWITIDTATIEKLESEGYKTGVVDGQVHVTWR